MSNRGKSVVIVCLVGALLAGCGNQQGSAPSKQAQTQKRVTLKLWHALDAEASRAAIQAAVDRFQSANPLVTVEVEVFDTDTYKKTLAEAEGGRMPDVFFTWGGSPLLAMAKRGKVADLSKDLATANWKGQFLPSALDFCADSSGSWAIPVEVSFVPVWYNVEICKDHRVKIPKTLGQFIAACQDLHGEGMTPLALGNKDKVPGGMYFAYLASRQGGVQLFLDVLAGKDGATFNDPVFVKAGDILQRFVRMQSFPSGFNDQTADQAAERFVKFQSAMCMMGMELVDAVKKGSEKLYGKMDCFPFPPIPDAKGDGATVLGGVESAFAVSSASKDRPMSVMLLRYLTDDETTSDLVGKGRIPARVLDEKMVKRLPPPTQKAYAILTAAKRIQPYYHRYLPAKQAEEYLNATHELLGNLKLAPEAAAARVAQQ
jgi:raffinose/stachyose/melibiose transport system substrate-binding protein